MTLRATDHRPSLSSTFAGLMPPLGELRAERRMPLDTFEREPTASARLSLGRDAIEIRTATPGWWPAPPLRDVADGKALVTIGHEGPPVETLQARLMQLGHLAKGTPDGLYGVATYDAVRDFQRSKGLVEDGVVGPDTVVALGLAKPGARESTSGQEVRAAIAAIDDVLIAPVKPHRASSGMLVVRDAAYVNNADDANPSKDRTDAARVELAKNTALEKAALARLSPSEASSYRKVAARVEQTPDHIARLALQRMLLAGDLPGGRDLKGGQTTLGALEGLLTASFGAQATGGLTSETYRGRILCDAIQELAHPGAMAQRDRGTCAATVVEMKLAHEHPAEFLRIVTGLAGPTGRVTLANGETLAHVAHGPKEARSAVQQLMAPALMGHTATGWTRYVDAPSDDHFETLGFRSGEGLDAKEVDALLEALYGYSFSHTAGLQDADATTRWKAAADVLRRTSKGEWVPVGMRYAPAGQSHDAHKLIATGLEYRADEHGKQRAMMGFLNPWGQREYIEFAEFAERLRNVNHR